MSTPTAPDLVLPEEVISEVRRKSAQIEFDSFRETVADRLQDAAAVDVYMLEDPDEDDRNWVVFELTMPINADLSEIQKRKRCFYDALMQNRPHIAFPICSLSIRFSCIAATP
jgi:hypothetical protein